MPGTNPPTEEIPMSDDTTLVLTGLRSGYRISTAGSCGLMRNSISSRALVGYALTTETGKDGLPYLQVSLTGEEVQADPPVLDLAATYTQTVAYPEVDLDLRFTDLPAGTEVEVASSKTALAIPRQPVEGSSLIGMSGSKLGAFTTDLVLRLWLADPEALVPGASLTLSLSRIEKTTGGDDRKIVLQKIALPLSL